MSEIEENSSPATADVYAGDTTTSDSIANQPRGIFSYTIKADPDPSVLARVANVFNLANMAPRSANLSQTADALVMITIEIGPIGSVSAEMICRKIAQLTCVNDVVLAEAQCPRRLGASGDNA